MTRYYLLPLLGCQKSSLLQKDIDNTSHIKNFELIQDNPNKKTSIIITSPKAIINTLNADIEIFNSKVKILKDNKQNLEIVSGNSLLNNSKNILNVYNNVNISILDSKNTFIKTDSFSWNLKSSFVNLYSPLEIQIDNSKIQSSNGNYHLDSQTLLLKNIVFNRSFLNSQGKMNYHINIISDNAKWLKKDNSLEFSSINKQVESKIDFLQTKYFK